MCLQYTGLPCFLFRRQSLTSAPPSSRDTLVPVAARESPLKLNKPRFRGSFFMKPKLCFSLWHAHRNSSCSNDGFSATFDWSRSNLTKGPPYLIWQYWLGVLGVYLSVTSQLTVESRIDRAENAKGLGWGRSLQARQSCGTPFQTTWELWAVSKLLWHS